MNLDFKGVCIMKEICVFTKRSISEVVNEIVLKLENWENVSRSDIRTKDFLIRVYNLNDGARGIKFQIGLYDEGFAEEELQILRSMVISNTAFVLGEESPVEQSTLLTPLRMIDYLLRDNLTYICEEDGQYDIVTIHCITGDLVKAVNVCNKYEYADIKCYVNDVESEDVSPIWMISGCDVKDSYISEETYKLNILE